MIATVIVECLLPNMPTRVNEVHTMARTVGYYITDIIVQKRKSIHHSFTIGVGKLHNLKNLVLEKNVDLIIFTNTLPSSQIFKIQKEIGNDIKVIDRNLLILELFEKRARTREALLQIRLARLKYTFSWGREYLKLQGILGEQVGWSGPGDYPFQNYESEARRRIKRIRKELEIIRHKKDLLRIRRHELGFPIVALSGYTQSGKTTFFNKLVGEKKQIGLGPFTTLQTFARKVDISKKMETTFILIDSIGFIEDMHPFIIDAFDATLREIANADIIIMFVDSSDDLTTVNKRLSSSNNILRRLEVSGEIIVCINKIDLVGEDQLEKVRDIIMNHFPNLEIFSISAKTGKNIAYLMATLEKKITRISNNFSL